MACPGEVDVAIAWLPVPDTGALSWRVVAREDIWVALAPSHQLADLPVVPFTDLADEPFIALPRTAGAQRDFWLGAAARQSRAVITGEADYRGHMAPARARLENEGDHGLWRRPSGCLWLPRVPSHATAAQRLDRWARFA